MEFTYIKHISLINERRRIVIMNMIERFHKKYRRDIEKGNNLANMFLLDFLVTCIMSRILDVIESLLKSPFTYYKIILNLFVLGSIFLFYMHKKKSSISKNVWQRQKMNINLFLCILSWNIVLNNIGGIIAINVTRFVYAVKKIENTVIPGTIQDIGTNADSIICAVIIGPIIEELIFRGAGLSLFRKNDNKLEAIIFTSIFFGLMHGNLTQTIDSSISGLLYGYVAIEFGIAYSILFHILSNGMVYIQYFLNNDIIMNFLSILILFWWTWNRKAIVKKLKMDLKTEKSFSMKRLFMYFLDPILLFFTILSIFVIIFV